MKNNYYLIIFDLNLESEVEILEIESQAGQGNLLCIFLKNPLKRN